MQLGGCGKNLTFRTFWSLFNDFGTFGRFQAFSDVFGSFLTFSWPAYKLSGYQAIRKYTHLNLSGNGSHPVIKSYQEIVPIRKVVVTESFPLCLGSPIAR